MPIKNDRLPRFPFAWLFAPLELCKKLEELGVKDDVNFWWVKEGEGEWTVVPRFGVGRPHLSPILRRVRAFSATELGYALPAQLEIEDHTHYLETFPLSPDGWRVMYRSSTSMASGASGTLYAVGDTEAIARARLRITLIEKGIVKP